MSSHTIRTGSSEVLLAKIYEQSKCDLFICTGTVTHYTSLAIHQGCIISDSAQEKMGTFSVPKSLQESLQKKETTGRFRQMSSRTWQSIWSASLRTTDLRKCHFWKVLFQNKTSPFAFILRYTINSIKAKWRCHLETQRTYFTLTIKMFQSYCFVLKWNLSKLIYPAEFFQFCRKLICSIKLITGFFCCCCLLWSWYFRILSSPWEKKMGQYSDYFYAMKTRCKCTKVRQIILDFNL